MSFTGYTQGMGIAARIKNRLDFGNYVAHARRAAGLTQAELAEKARIHRVSLSEIERGSTAARLDTILAIMRALGMQLRAEPRPPGEFDLHAHIMSHAAPSGDKAARPVTTAAGGG